MCRDPNRDKHQGQGALHDEDGAKWNQGGASREGKLWHKTILWLIIIYIWDLPKHFLFLSAIYIQLLFRFYRFFNTNFINLWGKIFSNIQIYFQLKLLYHIRLLTLLHLPQEVDFTISPLSPKRVSQLLASLVRCFLILVLWNGKS